MEKIEELIEAYETTVEVANDYLRHSYNRKVEVEKQMAVKIIENLNELKSSLPKPVEVPEFPEHIIEYLEWCKLRDVKLKDVIAAASAYHSDYAYWTEEEIRKIAVAYSTGDYTVVKEPLYYIELPLEGKTVRYCDQFLDDPKSSFFSSSYTPKKLTEQEIKAIDERYWAFAVPVEGAE